jgi:alpha-mannosidase
MTDSQDLIEKFIQKLRQLTEIDVQNNWSYSEDSHFQPATVNSKGYITWPAGARVYWLKQTFVIPERLQEYPLAGLSLRLCLTWWAQLAEIFVNGALVQTGDLFDSSTRLLLTPSVIPGETITVLLRLVSPSHDIGALMKSKCIYEYYPYTDSALEPSAIADEITILYRYLHSFEPDRLNLLFDVLDRFEWKWLGDSLLFDLALKNLRHNLLPLTNNIPQRRFHLLGHAHLDMAWLWTARETYDVAVRTFSSVLNLQKDFPDLTFCHTSPALYAWLENNRLDLFESIQTAAKQGRWEVLGGMWVEPEVNLISGESLVRQLLYGQRYVEEKFGAIATIVWLPDSFGFCWQLPQICRQSGIEYFVTGKLHWNDTNKFPYGCFWWESPDRTRILTLMSPPNVAGVMDTNPLIMSEYAISWEEQTGLQDIFWLPGVGDHGGGPTRDMLEVAQRWQSSPFFPQLEFTTARDYLQKIVDDPNLELPIYQDELYLEFHRGCYTTHAEQKKFNRYCEGLLYEAELFATIANYFSLQGYYRAAHLPIVQYSMSSYRSQEWEEEIETAWKKVLFNQFHDILPGTSIADVFVEANRDWEETIELGEKVLQSALEKIVREIGREKGNRGARRVVVFNALNWSRSQLVELELDSIDWEVRDRQGNVLPSQILANNKLAFLAEDIPSVGYCLYELFPCQRDGFQVGNKSDYLLENEYLRATIDPQTGELNSLFDLKNQKEVIKEKGNQLEAFEDRGQYWDAWNIDPHYQEHPLPQARLQSIQWLELGKLRQSIRVIRQIGQSDFQQDYILDRNSPILKISTRVDWQEERVLVKATFPLNVSSDIVTYEIPCGAIARSTQPQTSADKAKWEVFAHRWLDLNDGEYGVSLLNDCKYGCDSKRDRLRLTLLRSSRWPDPEADRGIHEFTYAIYPHCGDWKSALTVRQGYELNHSLKAIVGEDIGGDSRGTLPERAQFLDLQAENLILMALKPSREGGLVMRCYECHGEEANLELAGDLKMALVENLDLLERIQDSEKIDKNVAIAPWQIRTFKLR